MRLETPGEVRYREYRVCPFCGGRIKFFNRERGAFICERGCARLGKLGFISPYGQAWRRHLEGVATEVETPEARRWLERLGRLGP